MAKAPTNTPATDAPAVNEESATVQAKPATRKKPGPKPKAATAASPESTTTAKGATASKKSSSAAKSTASKSENTAPADKAPPPRRKAAAATPKPRATTRTPASGRARTAASTAAAKVTSAAQSVAESAPVQFVADKREQMGDRNFFASVIGGFAAIGAAVAGVLFALKKGDSAAPGASESKGKKPRG